MVATVVVASTAPIKRQAVRRVFRGTRIVPCEAPSGVPNQPRGVEEARRGANNRFVAAAARHPDANLIVAVENFIIEGKEPSDMAYILVGPSAEKAVHAFSAPVKVHATYQYTPDRTWGEDLAATRRGDVDPKDPHRAVGHVSREDLLVQAMLPLRTVFDAVVADSSRAVDTLPAAGLQSPALPTCGLSAVDVSGKEYIDPHRVFQSPRRWRRALRRLVGLALTAHCTKIGVLQGDGFLLGGALAHELNLPLACFCDRGTLSGKTLRTSFPRGDATCTMELSDGAVARGDSLLLVDSVVDTWDELQAARSLAEAAGATVTAAVALYCACSPPSAAAVPVAAVFAYETDSGEDVQGTSATGGVEECKSTAAPGGVVQKEKLGSPAPAADTASTLQVRGHPEVEYLARTQGNFLPLQWDYMDLLTHLHSFGNGLKTDCTYFVSLARRSTVMEQLMALLGAARHCVGTLKVILPSTHSHSYSGGWNCTTLNDTVLELFGASLQTDSASRYTVTSGDTTSSAKRQLAKWAGLPVRYVHLERTPAFLAHCPGKRRGGLPRAQGSVGVLVA